MIVWVLFLVLLSPVQGFSKYNFVEKYDSKEECNIEKARILADMKKSYLGDDTFDLECQPREKR